jgi:putative hemolysin
VAEHLDITFPEGPYETVAGYVLALLARTAASEGDTVEETWHRFTVLAMDGNRIDGIRIEPVDGRPARP